MTATAGGAATLRTRKPTGRPSWPIMLVAGVEKSGKTYAAAVASASAHVGRTLWVGVGEDDPDEYGAIPGARFEIVEHDGTYRGVLAALTAAAAQPWQPAKPNLIVLDSATRLWDLLVDQQQSLANDRARRKAERGRRTGPADEDATITQDQWNTAKQRWAHLIGALRDHQGPSIVTARLDNVAVVDSNGQPTRERDWRIKAEKTLPYDVGVIVELHGRGDAHLSGVRSLRWTSERQREPFADFTVEKVWTALGVTGAPEANGPRRHTENAPGDDATAGDIDTARDAVRQAAAAAGVDDADDLDQDVGSRHRGRGLHQLTADQLRAEWRHFHARVDHTQENPT